MGCKLVCFSFAKIPDLSQGDYTEQKLLVDEGAISKMTGVKCGRAFLMLPQARGGSKQKSAKRSAHGPDRMTPPPLSKTCFFFFVGVSVVHDQSLQSCMVA